LFETEDGPQEGVLTPDGRTLVYRTARPGPRRDIWSVSLDGDRKPRPLLTSEFDESVPRLSPDGRWLAYASDESGALEVYVRAFPGPGGRWKISSGGGSEPVWARSGDRIFYRNGRQLVAATVRVSPAFAPIRREVLFESDLIGDLLHANFDVAPDGKHFLMLAPTGDAAQIVVALNWTATLRGNGSARSPTR
jgi:Tol biopolymer transport system component